jgi:energy-coupling factor transporter ATP-binding protein EcfA2
MSSDKLIYDGMDARIFKIEDTLNKIILKLAMLENKDIEIKNLSSKTAPVGKFAVSTSRGGGNYFNLKATNGQVILTSVMHASLADCNAAIESVREYCTDDSRYERKISADNKPYFNLTSPEGQVIGKSEMYEFASIIGMVFQNPDDQIVSLKVLDEVAWGVENLGFEHEEIIRRVNEVMDLLAIGHLKDRLTFAISVSSVVIRVHPWLNSVLSV